LLQVSRTIRYTGRPAGVIELRKEDIGGGSPASGYRSQRIDSRNEPVWDETEHSGLGVFLEDVDKNLEGSGVRIFSRKKSAVHRYWVYLAGYKRFPRRRES
jgi:hypothetical protein